jgi:dephospho-CoA kinase
VASGKSLVAELLARRGAAVIDADRLAHEVLKRDDVKQLARHRWGADIFDHQGEIDRKRLGQIVFASAPEGPRELKILESWTHPRVRQMTDERIRQIADEGVAPAIVLDVPLLVEAGWHPQCDHVLMVDVPQEVRQARALARGWTAAEFARREAAQLPLAEKRGVASLVIDNSGSAEATKSQIDNFWDSLISRSLPK